MITLKAHLKTLNFSTQLASVNDLMDVLEPKVTLLGERVVKLHGFMGSVSLKKLAEKIMDVAELRFYADDLTPSESITGTEIVEKLGNFYKITDSRIQKSIWFIFLNWLRECGQNPVKPAMAETNFMFRAYSKVKFCELFGVSSDKICSHPAYYAEFQDPIRIIAEIDKIMDLLPPDDPRFFRDYYYKKGQKRNVQFRRTNI